ncbi:phage filamentation protein Fil family protein [Erwinia sp. 9145]|uniref:phage filamentation protein Fil family protein n=1 Tax=Erwinia sp. 9145 TaxID=1500895 RepID=UPI000907763D|nr:phage filamentation protein Fil family protein [Erwinia sp. 9145]
MISFAARLTRQSPSVSYGNGWITGDKGQRWHPCNDQTDLLKELSGRRKTVNSRKVSFRGIV